MPAAASSVSRGQVLRATVTPLASILGSGLLIIVPVLERTLGSLAVLGAVGVSVLAWLVGTAIRHNVTTIEPLAASGELDPATARLERIGDAVIVVAYIISVALYLRIMAEYILGYASPGAAHPGVERLIAAAAVMVIVMVGISRGFAGLDRLDRVSLIAVLVLPPCSAVPWSGTTQPNYSPDEACPCRRGRTSTSAPFCSSWAAS